MSDVTDIFNRAQAGAPPATDQLLPLIYDELRRLAARKMAGEAPGQTLQATALVHEAWLRLAHQPKARWQNRQQFYAMAAEVMRRILVDRARRRRARKHGGHLERLEVDVAEISQGGDDAVILQVHEALERLATHDPVKAEVVALRFFVGLEHGEIAALLGVSEKTVRRHWSFAKAWLFRDMQQGA